MRSQTILSAQDKAARTSAYTVLAVCGIFAVVALFQSPVQTQAAAQPTPQATATPTENIIIITATPALPTPRPTETAVPTTEPVPIIVTSEPQVIYVEVEVTPVPTEMVIEAPVIPPTEAVREVAPGIEHGTRPSGRQGPGTNGPSAPPATPAIDIP